MKFFNNLSIGAKFLSSSLLMVGILTVISWQSIGSIENCHHACGALLGGAMTTKSLAQSVQTDFYALAETANQTLFYTQLGDTSKSSALQAKFSADAQALIGSLDAVLDALKADPQVDPSIIRELTLQADNAKTALNNEYIPLIKSAASDTADFTQSTVISQKIGAHLDRVFQGIARAGDTVYDNYLVYLLGIILKLKIFIVIAVVFSIIVVLLLTLTLRKPLREVEQVAGALANLDFTTEIKQFRNDEIGNIQRALITIRDSLRRAIDELNDHLMKMTQSSKRLNTVITESSESLGVITGNMDAMQTETNVQLESVAQTSHSVNAITRSIDSLDHAVHTQAAHIVESSAAIEEMVANIASIRSVVSNTTKTTETLSKSSETGHKMLIKLAEELKRIEEQSATLQSANKTIAEITGQTNILAMNAAIEAAHAGEAGKGFAVVAGEIRKLAELSGKESEAISQEIQKMGKAIAQIGIVSNETVGAMDTIFTEIKAMDSSFGIVTNAVEEQAAGGGQILTALKTIQEMTAQVRDETGIIHRQSGSIHQEIEKLEQISQNVTKRVQEVRLASGSIASFLENAHVMIDTDKGPEVRKKA